MTGLEQSSVLPKAVPGLVEVGPVEVGPAAPQRHSLQKPAEFAEFYVARYPAIIRLAVALLPNKQVAEDVVPFVESFWNF